MNPVRLETILSCNFAQFSQQLGLRNNAERAIDVALAFLTAHDMTCVPGKRNMTFSMGHTTYISNIRKGHLISLVNAVVAAIRGRKYHWVLEAAHERAHRNGVPFCDATRHLRDLYNSRRRHPNLDVLPIALRHFGLPEPIALAISTIRRELPVRRLKCPSKWVSNDIFFIMCSHFVRPGLGSSSLEGTFDTDATTGTVPPPAADDNTDPNDTNAYFLVCSFCGRFDRCQNGHIIPRSSIVAYFAVKPYMWHMGDRLMPPGIQPNRQSRGNAHSDIVAITNRKKGKVIEWRVYKDLDKNILPECFRCNGYPMNELHSIHRATYKVATPTKRSRYYFVRNFSWFVLFWFAPNTNIQWGSLPRYLDRIAQPVHDFVPLHYDTLTWSGGFLHNFVFLVALYVHHLEEEDHLRTILSHPPTIDFVRFALGSEAADQFKECVKVCERAVQIRPVFPFFPIESIDVPLLQLQTAWELDLARFRALAIEDEQDAILAQVKAFWERQDA